MDVMHFNVLLYDSVKHGEDTIGVKLNCIIEINGLLPLILKKPATGGKEGMLLLGRGRNGKLKRNERTDEEAVHIHDFFKHYDSVMCWNCKQDWS